MSDYYNAVDEIVESLRQHIEALARAGVTLDYADAGVHLQPNVENSVVAKPEISELAALGTPDTAPSAQPSPEQRLAALRAEIGDCMRCKLCRGRANVVFGEGSPQARLMFVGEAPGADEDAQGRPFVGSAGQLLTRIIQAIDMQRDEVYIANVVKCRPPGNRDPEDDETATCLPFLQRQIEIIRPQIICTLGRIAAHTLLGTTAGITRLRGTFQRLGDVLVMPTYHPSYLLRSPERKKETWIDVQMIQRELEERRAQGGGKD